MNAGIPPWIQEAPLWVLALCLLMAVLEARAEDLPKPALQAIGQEGPP